jgi:hypothetical protein
VAFSVVLFGFGFGFGCSDRKSGGLPPATDWQAPVSADAGKPAVVETPTEILARCAARAFVDDAARDGNLPGDIIDDVAVVPDDRAVVLLRALATASSRLPRADQHAVLLAQATLMLAERGVTDTAPAALQRVAVLIDRPADSEFRPEIAAAYAARTWGRLGDADAVKRLGADPRVGPHVARGLAEGGHGDLADQTLGRIVAETSSTIDPLAAGEIAVTELVRGRADQARTLVAAAPAGSRSVYALLLATAAVERKHPDARAIFDEAAAIIDREPPGRYVGLKMAELAQAVGDTAGAAARRGRARAAVDSFRDDRDPFIAASMLYGLHVLALEAGATDEAAAVLAEMETRGAPPWAVTLARGVGLARKGELKRAIEEVAKLPAAQSPPRGVVHLEVLIRHLARPQADPELERWLTAHICDGIE